MTDATELAGLGRRLEQVENAVADVQARVPALRLEVHGIRETLAELARTAAAEHP